MHIQKLKESACSYIKTGPELIVPEDTWLSSDRGVLMTDKNNCSGIIVAVHNPAPLTPTAYLGHFSLDTFQGQRSMPYRRMLSAIAAQSEDVDHMSAWIGGASTVQEAPGVDQDTLEQYSQLVEADRLAVAEALGHIGIGNILVNLLSGNRPVESAMLDPMTGLLAYSTVRPIQV